MWCSPVLRHAMGCIESQVSSLWRKKWKYSLILTNYLLVMRLFTCNKPVKWKTRCVNAASCYSFWNSCWGYNLHLKIHESLLIVFLFHINKTVDYNHLLCSRIWGFPTSTSYQFVKCFRHLEYFAVYTFKNITNQDFCLNLSYCFYSKTFSQVDLIYFY